jgi:hypothetical protein
MNLDSWGPNKRIRIHWDDLFSVAHSEVWRSCIRACVRNNSNALSMLMFCSRDVRTARITYSRVGNRTISSWRWHTCPISRTNLHPKKKKMRDVINYCRSRQSSLWAMSIHTTFYGEQGTDINPRGWSLVEYLLRPNLDILNTGYKPTFVISNR